MSNSVTMTIKDRIFGAEDRDHRTVVVTEWDATVVITAMSGKRRSQWADKAFDEEGKIRQDIARGMLLVHCLEDETGNPIFTPEDAERLEAKNGAVLGRLFAIAKQINGLGSDEVDAAEKK
jgi:hypothetical protein